MSARTFRLTRLLGLRQRAEEQRRLELGERVQERDRRAGVLGEALERIECTREQMERELGKGLRPDRWSIFRSFLENLDRAKGRRQRELLEMKPLLEQARKALEEALKERRILERLQENWQAARDEELRLKEQQELDETGMRIWQARQSAERPRREADHEG